MTDAALGEVLGTRVFAIERPAPRALLISDLHVPADGGPVLLHLQAALAAARRREATLFVLGDLFDSYVSRGQVRHGVWAEVAAMFAAAVAAGTPIELLPGNRDFLLGAEFVRASRVRLVDGGLRGEIGGVDTLLLHGDELCQNDLPYQRAKRWLRHPATRWLARRMPVRLALGTAERARAKSRRVIASGDPARFLPTRAAIDAALAAGARRLVFGHIHQHARGAAGDRFWVLPAFDASAIAYWLESSSLTSVRLHGPEGQFEAAGDPETLQLPA